MKLVCTQENFKKAVFDTERVTGKQKTLPILNNILLEAEKGRLKFSATNLEVGVISGVGAKVEAEGKITIPAKIISSFVNNLPESETITVDAGDQMLTVSSGRYQAKIKGLSAQDFPIIPKMDGDFCFSVSAPLLKEYISKVLVCVSPNETRPELTGVNMLLFPNEVVMAGTDSFRLAETVLPFAEAPGENYSLLLSRLSSVIIPAATLSEIVRVISPLTEKVSFSIEENQIFFEMDNVQIVSRLINGKYPEYKQIIPQSFATRAVLPKEDFARAIRLAGVFSGSKASGEVKLQLNSEKGEIRISAQSQETGENEGVLKADITGPDQEINFNPRYLLDGISSIVTTQAAFLSNSASSPAGLRAIDEEKGTVLEKYTYIVMPIKN